MTNTSDTSRLDALEMRIAHQDETIDELNAAVTEQWKMIDHLKRKIERMEDSVSANTEAPAAHKPPPHY